MMEFDDEFDDDDDDDDIYIYIYSSPRQWRPLPLLGGVLKPKRQAMPLVWGSFKF